MKTLLSAVMMVCLLLLPLEGPIYSQEAANNSLPVAQALVREGDFAVALVEALRLGETQNEVEAESTLASIGIAPQNGWIADYPITPDILVEVEDATGFYSFKRLRKSWWNEFWSLFPRQRRIARLVPGRWVWTWRLWTWREVSGPFGNLPLATYSDQQSAQDQE